MACSLFAQLANAEQRGAVQYEKETQSLLTDDNQPLIGASFVLDLYDIDAMKLNESDYEAYFKSLVIEQGANAIRIAPWIGYWEHIDHDSQWYQTHLDNLHYFIDTTTKWAEESGAYAVLSYGPANDLDRAKAFWDIFAAQYKDESHVIFEVTTDEYVRFGRLKLGQLHKHLKAIAPSTHKLYSFAESREQSNVAIRFSQYGKVDFAEVQNTYQAIQDFIIEKESPKQDYAIKSTLGNSVNRWESVAGMSLSNSIPVNDISSVTFDIKADTPQSYWVYLRDAGGNDLANYFNGFATDGWSTITLSRDDFGTVAEGEVASVQFFIGYDANYDTSSTNVFHFDNISLSSVDGNYIESHGSVDETGTGWLTIGYGQTSVVYDKNSPDEPVSDETDYVVQADVAGTVNRWDSVQGMSLETPISFADLTALHVTVKAKNAQSFWVYLRDENDSDIATYYNAEALEDWSSISLSTGDFGLSGLPETLISSVQFFIGLDNTDNHSSNTFFFDDLVVESSQGEVQGSRGTVNELGTGWNVGYGKLTTIVTQEQADAVIDYGDSYAIRSQIPGVFGNRWDSITGLALEDSAHIDELRYISFDVKADVRQGYWVYLRDENDVDIGAHYNTTAGTEWQTVILRPSDFNRSSLADIASIQFFIGAAEGDTSANNAFYFDNISVVGMNGGVEGSRGRTDEFGTGWFELGYGHTNTVIQRDPASESILTPPPTVVAYDIQYQRIGGTDYYVSPEGDDNNDGLSSSTPFQDPQTAADRAGPGDRILLMPGTYVSGHYSSVINLANSGTADNWISIEPLEPNTVHFDVNGNIGVVLTGAAYVRVKGLKMKGIADTLTPVEAESLRLENPYSIGLVGNGIGTETKQLPSGENAFPHHIIIEENYISWMSGGCIGTKRADYILIRNNEVHHCGLYNIWAQSGISVWENFNYDDNVDTYRTVITGNRSYSNYNHFKFYASSDATTADSYTDGNGIIIDALAINQGYLNDGADGVYTGRTLIENNLVYDNGGKGINIYASDNIDVIHNVSYKNGQHPEIPGEIALGDTANVRMLNNIIYADASEPVFFAYQTQNILIDNNIIYKDISLDASFDNTNMATNTIEGIDPLLSSPDTQDENADFTLLNDSPAIDAAVTTELVNHIDFNGLPRPQGLAADIGAYEQ
uniref:choice-of-anchor Q domain-containing protein n=1 Tax=Shewanella gaetbuli TaxID=220752 RepID=UPI003B5CD061